MVDHGSAAIYAGGTTLETIMSAARKFGAWALLTVAWALAAYATDNNAAVVQALRTAWLNGALIPRICAIFPGDIVQTKSEFADIEGLGSKVLVLKDSLVKYEGDAVELQRGGISVSTGKLLAAHIAGLTVHPAEGSWTQFQVSEDGERIHVVATKGDLMLDDEKGSSRLSAGQEATREVPQKKRKKRAAGAPPAAGGSVMDSLGAKIIGGAMIAAPVGWVLSRSDDVISPDTP